MLSGYRTPWRNPFVERVIGTLRPECTDHVIALNAQHLERILREYVERFYYPARPHMSLEGKAPLPRTREAAPVEEVLATPVLGGLNQTYRSAA